MNEKDVPYVVHEGIVTRLERTNKRLWILCVILIITLVGTNTGWIINIYTEKISKIKYMQDMYNR
jgi:hypothetical protein